MRKNGSRLISLKQYKLTDLFLFALILVVSDLLAFYAPKAFPDGALYSFTMSVPIVALIMMRWGWPAVFFAVGDGILLSLLKNPSVWQLYLIYGVGNSLMLLLLIPLKFIGKKKIAGKWYFSALFVISAWILMTFGITIIQTVCYGDGFAVYLLNNIGIYGPGLLSLAIGLIVILILRRFDGMFEDQKAYLKRMDDERRSRNNDKYGEEQIIIDEETISILKKHDNDLYK